MPKPKRVIGVFDATFMVVGNMIGSGIFFLSGYAADPVSDGTWLILAWIGGGIMALLGAYSIAELATRFPDTGGDFLYLHRVYGSYPAFLYGWMSLLIFESGSIAVLALFGAKYFYELPLIGAVNFSEPVIASVLVLIFTLLHCLKVVVGSRFQSILTVLKIAGLMALITVLLGSPEAAAIPTNESQLLTKPVRGFARALIPIFFAYTGWNVAGYVAGEIKNPRRTLPVALIGGTVITILLYVLVGWGFLRSVGLEAMRGEELVPLMALEAVGKSGWTPYLTVLIFVSVIGSLSITIQTAGARVIQAMGDHGVFFRVTSRLNPRFGTPVNALIIQAIWTIALLFILDAETLVDTTVVVMILFSALTISTLLKVRSIRYVQKLKKKLHFTTPLFPLIPVVYIISAIFVSHGVVQYYSDPAVIQEKGSLLPLWGIFFVAAGSVVYVIWKHMYKEDLSETED